MEARGKWFSRLLIAANTLVGVAIVLGEPDSMSGRVVAQAGLPGYIGVVCLGCAALAAIVDAVVNDLMGAHRTLETTYRHRHLIFMTIALGSLSVLFALAKAHGWNYVMLHYVVCAASAVAIAVLDVRERVMGARGA